MNRILTGTKSLEDPKFLATGTNYDGRGTMNWCFRALSDADLYFVCFGPNPNTLEARVRLASTADGRAEAQQKIGRTIS